MFSLKPLLFMLLTVVVHGVSIDDGFHVFSVKSVLKVGSNSSENLSMVLADKRTRRRDPLNDFKYYIGGWNISDHHYFSSVSYSATPLFTIATIWFVGFGMALLLICSYYCCCRKVKYGYSRTAYALSLAFLTLFTIGAIVGCVILYTGQGKFYSSTTNTLDYVVRQSKDTSYNLNSVLEILDTAKSIGVEQASLPPNIKNNIDRVDRMVTKAARDLELETKRNKKEIQEVLNSVKLALIIIAAVMLLLALLGFLLSIFGLQVLVYILVVFGWILVTATYILCGIFVMLNNVMGDTCVAMDEWVQNPTAHTSLDDILPCVDNKTAQETLFQSKDVTFQLVGIVNTIITNVANIKPPPYGGVLNYNQSGPLVPILCNPLNADKTDRKCQANELPASNATQVWKAYVCQVSAEDKCTNVGRLTPKMYDQMSAAANVSSGLTNYAPFLVALLNCSFVRDTFTVVHKDHCPELTKYSKWVYIGLAMVSAAVMFSLMLWVMYARERRHRKYTKSASASEWK
uniref:uncharacterized protein LOC122610707 n=1 Tax=Erigeron canadensis TaxID=72917 RepID=UPI001CB8FCEB|nr:uncharacterized protein LOC122610707 [Erigeron canadensis]